ncbi:MAG: ferritin [Pseudomonadota bacterium]
MADLHELRESLSTETLDVRRAVNSIIEELNAYDWYQQRVDATKDEELRAVLAHNRDEEIEHASMILEYLRRKSSLFDTNLKQFLFTTADITLLEGKKNGEGTQRLAIPPLVATLGSLRKK